MVDIIDDGGHVVAFSVMTHDWKAAEENASEGVN